MISEGARSVVVNHATNKAIDERDALRAENERLKKENKFLRGVNDHGYGPDEGRFLIASYRLEQRFKIPEEATGCYIKWGLLHWRDADDNVHEEHPFAGDDLYMNPDVGQYWKRPDAIRATDEDEDGEYQEYLDVYGEDESAEDEPAEDA